MKTLKEHLPKEFNKDAMAYRFRDAKVVKVVPSTDQKWMERYRHAKNWYILENGFAVGFNDDPKKKSFPLVPKWRK